MAAKDTVLVTGGAGYVGSHVVLRPRAVILRFKVACMAPVSAITSTWTTSRGRI